MNNVEACYLSSTFFGPVDWYAQFFKYKKIYIEQFETYQKQTYRNRVSILSANGKLDFSIPVVKIHGNRTKINEVEILYETSWIRQFLYALESAYGMSAFYDYFIDDIKKIFVDKPVKLLDLNLRTIEVISKILRVELKYELTTNFELKPMEAVDYRNFFSPKNKDFLSQPAIRYYQVFRHKFDFIPHLSILDLIFNEGLDSITYLEETAKF